MLLLHFARYVPSLLSSSRSLTFCSHRRQNPDCWTNPATSFDSCSSILPHQKVWGDTTTWATLPFTLVFQTLLWLLIWFTLPLPVLVPTWKSSKGKQSKGWMTLGKSSQNITSGWQVGASIPYRRVSNNYHMPFSFCADTRLRLRWFCWILW